MNTKTQRVGRRRRTMSLTAWSRLNALSDEHLLATRICDLGVRIEGTPLEERIERLYDELEKRSIRFRPYFWLSDDWFTPDSFLVSSQAAWMAEDMQDSGVEVLVEKGKKFLNYLSRRKS